MAGIQVHAEHSLPSAGTRTTIAGASLVGLSYGLVRFSFGQFLPQMRADIGMSESMAGVVSTGVFFGACVALIVAARLTELFGPRAVAVAAGSMATLGLLAVTQATDPLALAGGLTLAGVSSGLSMPPMVAAVRRTVRHSQRDTANAIINAGTSGGIVIAGPVALVFAESWRQAYVGFAIIGLVVSVFAFVATPAGTSGSLQPRTRNFLVESPAVSGLMGSAFVMGFITSGYWSFAGDFLRSRSSWSPQEVSVFWMVLGIVGFVGATAGALVRRFGINVVHRASVLSLTVSLGLFAAAPASRLAIYISGVLFGVTYIMQSGVYVIWGTRVVPQAPGIAVAAAFFMIPAGQVVGTPLFGLLSEHLSGATAFGLFALVALAGMAFRYVPNQTTNRVDDARSATPRTGLLLG